MNGRVDVSESGFLLYINIMVGGLIYFYSEAWLINQSINQSNQTAGQAVRWCRLCCCFSPIPQCDKVKLPCQ